MTRLHAGCADGRADGRAAVCAAVLDPLLAPAAARWRRTALFAAASALCPAAWPAAVEVRVTDAGGRPLSSAVVFLESREARAAVKPAAGVEIVQIERQFAPQVTVVPVGTAVSFPNRDSVRHHVYSFSPVKKLEIKLYVGTPAAPVVFDRPGIAVLGCNIHDNMTAWVVVVETPWYGQSGADGRVAWPQVPPGTYRLLTWHPSLAPGAPAAEQALKVEAGALLVAVKLTGAAP